MGKRSGRKNKSQESRIVLQDSRRATHSNPGGIESKTHPICRLSDDGPDYGVEPQPGDETAYAMDPFRSDDCFAAAIATALQVPIEQVPDLVLDKRLEQGEDRDELSLESWERIGRWAGKRGLSLRFHSEVPVPRERWVGVVEVETAENEADSNNSFADHCLVMCHDRLVFDPSCSVITPPGMRLMTFYPSDISYGISFDKEE